MVEREEFVQAAGGCLSGCLVFWYNCYIKCFEFEMIPCMSL